MASNPPSPWAFGGPPTASELIVGSLGVVTAVSGLAVADTIAWRWFLAGAVVVVVSLGPVKSYMVATGASARSGEFQDGVGLVGRAVGLLAVAAVLLWVISLQLVPAWSVFSLAQGGMLGVAGVVAVRWIRHREVAS